MAALPYMPLYVADYLADAAHLSAAEHGAYLLLIMNYWQRGKPLPSDDVKLARIARMSDAEWSASKHIISEFFQDDGEFWRHKRIDKELVEVAEKSEKARAAGKASAERRANGRSTDVQRSLNHTDTDTDKNISLTSSAHPIADADGDAGPSNDAPSSKPRKADDWPTGAFGIFWARYPAKVGKAAAERKFETVRKSGRVAWGDLMAGLDAYIANKPPDRDWCHPTTWLNQGRWDDQYGAKQGGNDAAGSRNQQKSASERTADMFLAGFAAAAGAQRVADRLDRPDDPLAAGDGGGKIVDLRAAR